MRVIAAVFGADADAGEGHAADAEVQLLIWFLEELGRSEPMGWEEHTLYLVQTSHSASISS